MDFVFSLLLLLENGKFMCCFMLVSLACFFALVLHVIPLLALLACVWSCLDLGVFCPLLGWPRMEQAIFNIIVRGSEALFKKKYKYIYIYIYILV